MEGFVNQGCVEILVSIAHESASTSNQHDDLTEPALCLVVPAEKQIEAPHGRMHFNRLELLLDSLVINAYPTGSANALQNLKGSRAARKYFPDDLYFRPRETSIGAIPRSRRAS